MSHEPRTPDPNREKFSSADHLNTIREVISDLPSIDTTSERDASLELPKTAASSVIWIRNKVSEYGGIDIESPKFTNTQDRPFFVVGRAVDGASLLVADVATDPYQPKSHTTAMASYSDLRGWLAKPGAEQGVYVLDITGMFDRFRNKLTRRRDELGHHAASVIVANLTVTSKLMDLDEHTEIYRSRALGEPLAVITDGMAEQYDITETLSALKKAYNLSED